MANDRHFLIDPAENAERPGLVVSRRGTCITIVLSDPNIAEVINVGYDRIVVERSDDSGLTFREITAPSQRPVLEREKLDYVIIDRGGDPNFLYRTRYIDTKTKELSEPSEDISGAGLAVQSLLSAAQLRRHYFFGIEFVDANGKPLADEVLQHYIVSAIRLLEHELDISIFPNVFDEFHDYYANDYQAFCLLQLDNYPLISVDEFRVQYPSGQTIVVFPQEWLRINAEHGQVQIVPTAGTLAEIQVGQGGAFLPAIYSGMQYLPQLFRLTYTAGFDTGRVPRNIIDLIGKLAAIGPLGIFGDIVLGVGVQNISLSLDGLSQSIAATKSAEAGAFGGRIDRYMKDIHAQIKTLRRYYKGVRGVVA
jgi:hypothetical protein